jgi:hypothetical protein
MEKRTDMNAPLQDPWKHVVESAKRPAVVGGEETAPYGFATKVASQWIAQRQRQFQWLWRERLALKVAAFSCAVALGSFVLTDRPTQQASPLFAVPDIEIPLTQTPSE